MSRLIPLLTVLTGGCVATPLDPVDTTTSSSAEGSSTADGSSTTDGCPVLPLCALCPDEMGALCGMACTAEGEVCSNEIGDGMSCAGGTWQCVVHPPLGEGCNRMCDVASECTEAGCDSGVELSLVAAGAGFAAGAYQLDLVRDGEASTCTFVISDDEGCALPPCVTDTTCNAYYDLGGRPPRISMVLPLSNQLAVTLARDGMSLLEAEPALSYVLSSPNGAGCTPVCANAAAQLEVP